MNINTFKENLKTLFSKNKIKIILKTLKEELNGNADLYSEVLQITRRYNELFDRKMAALIEEEVAALELNKISKSILYLINKMEQGDLKNNTIIIQMEITNPILLITDDKEKVQHLTAFLNQLNFTNVEVAYLTRVPEKISYDLVIFDNRHLQPCYNEKALSELEETQRRQVEERIRLMEAFISETTLFIIHFGEYLYWINDHRERVQAANSKFSLYARTKEMLDFINTYRV